MIPSRVNLSLLTAILFLASLPTQGCGIGLHSRYTMTYAGNQLSRMEIERDGEDYEERTGVGATGTITGFWYDLNGNMGQDMSRGILETRYNRHNLPTDVYFRNGHRQTITYDGFGQKRQVAYSQTDDAMLGSMMGVPEDSAYTLQGRRSYLGPHVFVNDSLEYSAFPGGYFTPKGTYYYITDWQGNNTAVFSGNGNLVQQTTYYPYGEPTIEPAGQRYLFGGKEREHAGGRNSSDFGPRRLATSTGRFTSPDPLTEKRYPITPYAYCLCDPINYIDPTGSIEWPVNETFNGGTRKHDNNYNEPRPRNGSIRYHHGVDINIGSGSDDLGAPVYATHDGIVVRVQDYTDGNAGGSRVKIQTKDGKVGTFYMHLNSICDDIKLNNHVHEGQQIGTIGKTGCKSDTSSPHLHYELFVNGEYSDPTNGAAHLIDPQEIINGGKNDNRLYQGGSLPELQVTEQKKDRPVPYLKIDTPPIPSQIQINYQI